MQKLKKLQNKIITFVDDEPAWKSILIACLAGLVTGLTVGFLDTLARDVIEQYNFLVAAERYLGK